MADILQAFSAAFEGLIHITPNLFSVFQLTQTQLTILDVRYWHPCSMGPETNFAYIVLEP